MQPPNRLPFGDRHQVRLWARNGLFVVLALAVAASWLLAVYLLDGRNMLNGVKLDIQTGRASKMQTINAVLARSASLSPHVEMLTVYATAEFFSVANKQAKGIPFDPATEFIFIINEDTHMDELPLVPTPAKLRVDDRVLEPSHLEMLTYSIHHKVTIATFPKFDSSGTRLLAADGETLELIAPEIQMTASGREYRDGTAVAVAWQLPISYPEGALSGERIPFSTTLALALGLLATVMTPCLLQLLVFYLSTLTGMSTERLEGARIEPAVRRRLLQTALGFVIGYTVLFTTAGALAGLAGETLQSMWNIWTRPLAITAGSLIVVMGLWMAVRARAPLVCRIPLINRPRLQTNMSRGGLVQSTLMGLGFAVGCSTCFGGALIATLLLYVGTLGSAWQGAFILFIFSLGVGIPFLLAAALLTRVMPLMQGMQRLAPTIGLITSTIVIAFGILMITDRFHLVSMWLAPRLGMI
jgi:cytochrome c-type biogenesis protein